MEDIVPRELNDYDKVYPLWKMTLYWFLGMSVSMSVICGLGAFLANLVFDWTHPPTLNQLAIGLGGIFMRLGLPMGMFCAVINPLLMRFSSIAMTDALYANNPKALCFPPLFATKDFSHRMVCDLISDHNINVMGNLYIGSCKLVFVPHRRNFFCPKKVLDINAREHVEIALVERQINPILRYYFGVSPWCIEVRWIRGSASFRVPEMEKSKVKLEAVIRSQCAQAAEAALHTSAN